MKRIYNYSFLLIAALIPFSMISAQEKKNEQKIKVVVDDGSGSRTIIDTTYIGGSLPKTIKTNEGKIIVIDSKEAGHSSISTDEGKEKIYVTVSSDSDEREDAEENVIVISSDKSVGTSSYTTSSDGHVYVLNKVKGSPDKKVIITSSANVNDEVDDKTDVSKYVIAKDGLVITVEGNDEAKAKEIIKMIQDKLGVKVDKEGKEIKK